MSIAEIKFDELVKARKQGARDALEKAREEIRNNDDDRTDYYGDKVITINAALAILNRLIKEAG